MKPKLFQEIALTRDLPGSQLKAGDIATLVDFAPSTANGEDGCVLEVFNALGESIAIVAVPMSAVETLRADEVLTVRSLASAG